MITQEQINAAAERRQHAQWAFWAAQSALDAATKERREADREWEALVSELTASEQAREQQAAQDAQT